MCIGEFLSTFYLVLEKTLIPINLNSTQPGLRIRMNKIESQIRSIESLTISCTFLCNNLIFY